MGGHQYQIEHHLKPSIPRYNLKRVNKLLMNNKELAKYYKSKSWYYYIGELKDFIKRTF